jgi:WD40 repeat protein
MNNKEFLSFHISNIKCIKFDPYSSRLATCGDDGKIDIYSSSNLNKPLTTILRNGNYNRLNDLSWSKLKNKTYLASCGEDKNKIIIFIEKKENLFKNIYEYSQHKFPVIKCEFCPFQYGLILLCGDAGGEISLHQYKIQQKNFINFKFYTGHSNINCLSWGPALKPINFDNNKIEIDYDNENFDYIENEGFNSYQFCSCGDDSVKIWKSENSNINHFEGNDIYNDKNNKIYSIKWLNYDGYYENIIVFGGENRMLMFYKFEEEKCEKIFEIKMENSISNIGMSFKGGYLIVTLLNKKVIVLEENLGYEWIIIKK